MNMRQFLKNHKKKIRKQKRKTLLLMMEKIGLALSEQLLKQIARERESLPRGYYDF